MEDEEEAHTPEVIMCPSFQMKVLLLDPENSLYLVQFGWLGLIHHVSLYVVECLYYENRYVLSDHFCCKENIYQLILTCI